ncbi:MAG: DUF4926 domain-containing protein [Rhodocyclaceae bacterium]|nr:DUF4926 domain-containing protein [Rhodocyclaceae bacterium]
MITEHAAVVLTENIPASGLEAGDVGVVVHVHDQGKAYEVEFMSLDGGTVAIQTLEARQVREARNRDIPHVRELLAA